MASRRRVRISAGAFGLPHQKLAKAKSLHDKAALQAQIDATDRQIDRLVYGLNGLNKNEIRIVEEATGR